MKTHSVEAELFRADERTDGEIWRSYKTFFFFCNFMKGAYKTHLSHTVVNINKWQMFVKHTCRRVLVFQNKPLFAFAATQWVILHPTWLYSIRFVRPLSNKTPCKPIIYPSDTYSQFYDCSKTLLIKCWCRAHCLTVCHLTSNSCTHVACGWRTRIRC